MPTAQRIHLSTVEYDVLWSHLGLGRMPYPLGVPSVGFRTEDRARVVAEAWDGLAGRGLADGTRLDDDVADLLRLLARPAVSLDALADIGRPLRALAARDGDRAAAAMLTDSGLVLTEIRPTAMSYTLVDLLPYAEPGPAHAFTFPYHALRAAIELEDEDNAEADMFFNGDEHDALVRAGLTQGNARLLAELVEARFRGGQFGVTTWRWPKGDKVRDSTLVTWFDTDAGRYLVVREQDWVSVTPAGADRIAARIDQVLAAYE